MTYKAPTHIEGVSIKALKDHRAYFIREVAHRFTPRIEEIDAELAHRKAKKKAKKAAKIAKKNGKRAGAEHREWLELQRLYKDGLNPPFVSVRFPENDYVDPYDAVEGPEPAESDNPGVHVDENGDWWDIVYHHGAGWRGVLTSEDRGYDGLTVYCEEQGDVPGAIYDLLVEIKGRDTPTVAPINDMTTPEPSTDDRNSPENSLPDALRVGASADIWYDAGAFGEGGDDDKLYALVNETQSAMVDAARIIEDGIAPINDMTTPEFRNAFQAITKAAVPYLSVSSAYFTDLLADARSATQLPVGSHVYIDVRDAGTTYTKNAEPDVSTKARLTVTRHMYNRFTTTFEEFML